MFININAQHLRKNAIIGSMVAVHEWSHSDLIQIASTGIIYELASRVKIMSHKKEERTHEKN